MSSAGCRCGGHVGELGLGHRIVGQGRCRALRSRACNARASSRRARAKPSAAAATVCRNTPGAHGDGEPLAAAVPISSPRGICEGEPGERVGAIDVDPLGDGQAGSSAATMNIDRPRAPAASPVRARTV